MANITTRESVLKVENLFVDGDTRTFTVKNPKASIATSEITSLNSFLQTNNLLIGDKWGGNFGRIVSVTTVETARTAIDLN